LFRAWAGHGCGYGYGHGYGHGHGHGKMETWGLEGTQGTCMNMIMNRTCLYTVHVNVHGKTMLKNNAANLEVLKNILMLFIDKSAFVPPLKRKALFFGMYV
jgi:hypothetical protein